MTDAEEDRVERAIAAAEDRAIPYQPCASCATMRAERNATRLVLDLERQARQLREDELKAENERLKTEVSIADQYDREANAKMLARQCDLARQAETERDRLKAEMERLEAVVIDRNQYISVLTNSKHKAEAERDRLKAEHERLRNSEIVANDEVVRLRDFAVSLKTHNERQAARHEQDIDTAFKEGWNYAKTSYTIADVSVALARYKAEQQQEGRDG